jgi:[CysO sulfur-carrier protein]-thiocarboxylate-dependent cysteine synthase
VAGQPHCIVVDMRGALAFKAGHIAGAINLPVEQLDEICEFGVPFSHDQRVLLVCPVGDQSRRFAAFLSQRGITCASLTGGFVAWRDAGEPIQKAPVKKK